ncbi:NADPH-dependent FMN reductase [Rhodococcoides yunnanense]|uniref:NADPH-dependent FMN reductase n=1 Tax=Rhodococcoides yunnanense TaxID=278209 RepID=UPI0009349B52|nr:NAD(P)H-dependent oxidoreductase [Rhodococcus yunnanensis]
MTEELRLVIVIGSVRDGRFGPVVAEWIAEQSNAHGAFAVTVVDLAEFDIPLALPDSSPKLEGDSYPRPDAMAGLTALLESADAFLLVTPEYNHSFPASLKAAIDWHFTQWAAKPVGLISYGGAAGGRHASAHLENVLSELGAVTIQQGLTFANYYTAWKDGSPVDSESAGYAKAMLDQLTWWARALSRARAESAYPF